MLLLGPRKAGKPERLLGFDRSRLIVTRVTRVSRAPPRKIFPAFLGPNVMINMKPRFVWFFF